MKNQKFHIFTLALTLCIINVSAHDIAKISPSGHTLYYNILQHDTIPYTVEVTACPAGKVYEGNIIIPDTLSHNGNLYFVTSIAPHAFTKSERLFAIELPNTLVSIGSNGFRDCINLRSITFPEAMTYIGSYSLVNCVSLQSLGIPKNVNFIGTFAFGNCRSLYNIYVDMENKYYSSMAGILFDKSGRELIHYPAVRDGESFDVPTCVYYIADWAFCGAKFLKYVDIPSSVVSIGRSAFWGCKSLINITIPNTVDVIKSRTFYDCKNLLTANVSKSTKVVTTAFPPYTRIHYTPKRSHDVLRDSKTKPEKVDYRPISLPMDIYASYDIKPKEQPTVEIAQTQAEVKPDVVIQTQNKEEYAFSPSDINIEEVIEQSQRHGNDYGQIVITKSPTGDENDDVVKDDELEVTWPVMDEDMEYYLSNYEKDESGANEKVEYIDPKHKNRNRTKDYKTIKKNRNYTLFGNDI